MVAASSYRMSTRYNNGDGISWQICHDVTVEDCHSHDHAGLGLHPGSGSQRPVMRRNKLERCQIGLFFCWGVKYGLAEENTILDIKGQGISIGHRDTDNIVRKNVVRNSGQTGILFRPERGAGFCGHRNLIEQNVIPGKTTRWLSRYADEICISFPGTEARLPKGRNIKLTGNPVRAEIVALNQRAFSECHPESASPELLILGGSQGADSLNAAVLAAIGRLSGELSGWKIVHQTGPRDIDTARQTYLKLGLPAAVEPFFHDMATLYSRSTIVISRSGATTLAELACIGTAMILLPYPHAADDHQMANAKAFVDCQAALLQKHEESLETTADHLASKLRLLLNDSESRTRMGLAAKGLAHPDAAEQIASVIQAAINYSFENRDAFTYSRFS